MSALVNHYRLQVIINVKFKVNFLGQAMPAPVSTACVALLYGNKYGQLKAGIAIKVHKRKIRIPNSLSKKY
jgi:hypothetical protein